MPASAPILLSLLASLVQAQSSTFLCGDPWCNPHHQPYPNVKSTLTGYNIVRGNPFALSKQNDPGFATSYIFQALVPADGGGFKLHPGITVREVVKCDLSLATSVITNARTYQETLAHHSSKGTDFLLKLDPGVLANMNEVKNPFAISFGTSFSASLEYKNNVEFFSKNHGVLTVNDATCSSYTTHLSSYNPPAFSVAFERALHELNSTVDQTDDVKDREFLKFIDNFGTHFLRDAVMGARLAISRRYKREEYRRSTDDDLKQCNVRRLNVFLGISIDKQESKCDTIQTDTLSTIDNVFIREYISSYGSRPARDLIEWSQQKFESPSPIKMSLSPILNLFQSSFMRKYPNIDYVAILRWLAPRYLAYCTKYKDQLGAMSCNSEAMKGCGWNDTCSPKTQQCIDDQWLPDGYTCCANACESLPCMNGGTCFDLEKCNYSCTCTDRFTGVRCHEKLIVSWTLATEVGDYLIAHTGAAIFDLRKGLYTVLQDLYRANYFVGVMTYDYVDYRNTDYDANDFHYISGNYARVKHASNYFLVSWIKKTSRLPSSAEMDDFRSLVLNRVTNIGCSMLLRVQLVYSLARQTGYPVQMVAGVRYGLDWSFGHLPHSSIYMSYVCRTDKSWWWGDTHHTAALLVVFGEG